MPSKLVYPSLKTIQIEEFEFDEPITFQMHEGIFDTYGPNAKTDRGPIWIVFIFLILFGACLIAGAVWVFKITKEFLQLLKSKNHK